MQSLDISSTEGTTQTLGRAAAPVSAGWLLRRMALWFLFVALGVAGSCLLYMAASTAEAESTARNTVAPSVARALKS